MSFLQKIRALAAPVDEKDTLWDSDRLYVLGKRVPFGFEVDRDDDGTIYLTYLKPTKDVAEAKRLTKAVWAGSFRPEHWTLEDVDFRVGEGVVVVMSLSDWGATNEVLVAEAQKIDKALKKIIKRAGEVPETRRRNVTSAAEILRFPSLAP